MNTFRLGDTYLLRGATIGDIEAIQGIFDILEFKAGEPVVSASDRGQDLMIVVDGRVRVESKEGDMIDELRVGAMIGEISFLDGEPRTANVFAVGDAKVAVIPASGLRDLMRERPALEVVIYKNAALALCQRLREANQQIESLLVPR